MSISLHKLLFRFFLFKCRLFLPYFMFGCTIALHLSWLHVYIFPILECNILKQFFFSIFIQAFVKFLYCSFYSKWSYSFCFASSPFCYVFITFYPLRRCFFYIFFYVWSLVVFIVFCLFPQLLFKNCGWYV